MLPDHIFYVFQLHQVVGVSRSVPTLQKLFPVVVSIERASTCKKGCPVQDILCGFLLPDGTVIFPEPCESHRGAPERHQLQQRHRRR